MIQYAVLIECVACGDKSVWYLNTESTDGKIIQEEVRHWIDALINADYNCDKCNASGMEILAFKEASDDASELDF